MTRQLTSFVIVALTASVAAAQPTSSDYAAWFGIMYTPVGGLSPLRVAPKATGETKNSMLALRFATWQIGDETDVFRNVGASYLGQGSKNSVLGATAVYSNNKGSDDGLIMVGAEVHTFVWQSAAASPGVGAQYVRSVNLLTSIGYGRLLADNGFDAIAVMLGLPFMLTREDASKAQLSVFVTPAYAYGKLDWDNFTSETGTRPALGGGVAWKTASGFGIHASIQKVFIDDSDLPANIGIAASWSPGRRPTDPDRLHRSSVNAAR